MESTPTPNAQKSSSSPRRILGAVILVVILALLALLVNRWNMQRIHGQDQDVATFLQSSTPEMTPEQVQDTVQYITENPTETIPSETYNELLMELQGKSQ